MTGTDFLLESLLRLTGVNIDDFKSQTMALVTKFTEQDALLRRIAQRQERIEQTQEIILKLLQPETEQHHDGHDTKFNGRLEGNVLGRDY